MKVLSTKTLKYKDRVLEIPICNIEGSPFCAATLEGILNASIGGAPGRH